MRGGRYTPRPMILAGIDEAGYGPVLGPLVVGCCAFEVQLDDSVCGDDAPLPCLWKLLRKHVSKKRSKNGKKLHVNDSKAVYSPNLGLKELERAVLALAACTWPEWDGAQQSFLTRLCPAVIDELTQYRWYADEALAGEFPYECDGLSTRIFANALRQEMDKASVRPVHLCARVVTERELNRMIDQTRNKASASFSIAAMHIDHLLKTFGNQNLVLVCDRQGGREHYGALLRQMFEDWSLEVTAEAPARSEYRLIKKRRDGAIDSVRMIFSEKAEKLSMSVAYASMISKYIREALMRRFNAFWRSHLPDLEPTAGYYNDGLRFLKDIDAKRSELGIEDAELVRSR